MKELSNICTVGLTTVEFYDHINSLQASSANNSLLPSNNSTQPQILSALQEINDRLACTESNFSDLTGVVANIPTVGVFPRPSEDNDDKSTNIDTSIDSIKYILASSSKCCNF